MMGFGAYFGANEIVSLCVSRTSYLFDIWNYVDVSRIALIYLYAYIRLYSTYDFGEAALYIFTVLNFLVWVRLMSLLR